MDPRLVLIGALVGLLVGLTGVGGSSLMAPLLILVVGLNPLAAVGTDLLYSGPTKLLGAIVHWRQGTVNLQLTRWLAYGGVPGAVLGIVALAEVQHHVDEATLNDAIKYVVGAMLLLVAALLVLTPILVHRSKRPPPEQTDAHLTVPRERVIALGLVVGFCVSLTSIGSGAVTVPALFLLAPNSELRRLVGSNIAFAAVLVPIAALGHLALGSVNVTVSATLLVGSLPGVFIGSRLCLHLPDRVLKPAMAGVLVWAGAALL
jgi:uncharacterized membrane protein YfcA